MNCCIFIVFPNISKQLLQICVSGSLCNCKAAKIVDVSGCPSIFGYILNFHCRLYWLYCWCVWCHVQWVWEPLVWCESESWLQHSFNNQIHDTLQLWHYIKRQSFIEKKNSSEPLSFKKLSLTSSGMAFFNSYRGNEVDSATDLVMFNIKEVGFIPLKHLANVDHGSFNIQGQIRWTKPEVIINLKKKGQSESETPQAVTSKT